MRALADVLAPWHEFVTLLGTAAGTLVALLFVAATLASGVFFSDRRAPLRLFLSASVVHFSSVLVVSLILLAPVENWVLLGAMVVVCGLVGLAYYGVAWRDAMRDGVAAAIDLEDRLWYAVLPVVIYLCEAASGVMLALRLEAGCVVLAASLGALLLVGIHNAWDITIWTITRRREWAACGLSAWNAPAMLRRNTRRRHDEDHPDRDHDPAHSGRRSARRHAGRGRPAASHRHPAHPDRQRHRGHRPDVLRRCAHRHAAQRGG